MNQSINAQYFAQFSTKKALRADIHESLGFPTGMRVFSYGNRKLPKSHLIVNMTTATACPAEPYCKLAKVCYAKKCERVYKSYRLKNEALEAFFKNTNFDEVVRLIESYIRLAPSNRPITHIRVNEAGDFASQYHLDMFEDIAKYMKEVYNIQLYAYSCRIDLDFSGVKHMIVNASRPEINNYKRIFKGVPKEEFEALPKKAVRCKGDCKLCSICASPKFTGTVYCKQH